MLQIEEREREHNKYFKSEPSAVLLPLTNTTACIASLLGVRMVAQSQIILCLVHHNTASDNREFATQSDDGIRECDIDNSSGVHLNVAQVTNVTHLVMRCTMVDLLGIVVGTHAGATVGQVSLLVNVESMLALLDARQLDTHVHALTAVVLYEGNVALHLGIVRLHRSDQVSNGLHGGIALRRRNEGCIY